MKIKKISKEQQYESVFENSTEKEKKTNLNVIEIFSLFHFQYFNRM